MNRDTFVLLQVQTRTAAEVGTRGRLASKQQNAYQLCMQLVQKQVLLEPHMALPGIQSWLNRQAYAQGSRSSVLVSWQHGSVFTAAQLLLTAQKW